MEQQSPETHHDGATGQSREGLRRTAHPKMLQEMASRPCWHLTRPSPPGSCSLQGLCWIAEEIASPCQIREGKLQVWGRRNWGHPSSRIWEENVSVDLLRGGSPRALYQPEKATSCSMDALEDAGRCVPISMDVPPPASPRSPFHPSTVVGPAAMEQEADGNQGGCGTCVGHREM